MKKLDHPGAGHCLSPKRVAGPILGVCFELFPGHSWTDIPGKASSSCTRHLRPRVSFFCIWSSTAFETSGQAEPLLNHGDVFRSLGQCSTGSFGSQRCVAAKRAEEFCCRFGLSGAGWKMPLCSGPGPKTALAKYAESLAVKAGAQDGTESRSRSVNLWIFRSFPIIS